MDTDAPVGDSSSPPSPAAPVPSVTDRLAALTPVERAEWRKTGTLPDARPAEPPPAADGDSAPPDSTDQSASDEDAAAPATDQPDPAPRRRKPANARFQELLDDRARERSLREAAERRLRDLEQQLQAPRASAAAPAASAPATPEPPPDVGTFEDYAEYTKALAAYEVRQALAAERQRMTEEQRTAQQQAEQARIQQGFAARVQQARQKYADFDAVALDGPTAIPPGSLIDAWIWEADDGAEVLYHLQKTPADLQRIQALLPFQQVKALVKLGDTLTAEPIPARRTLSHAPEPPPTLQTRGTPSDEMQQAVKQKDVAAYIAAANRRDLAAARK
jgi:hypothetical protein